MVCALYKIDQYSKNYFENILNNEMNHLHIPDEQPFGS